VAIFDTPMLFIYFSFDILQRFFQCPYNTSRPPSYHPTTFFIFIMCDNVISVDNLENFSPPEEKHHLPVSSERSLSTQILQIYICFIVWTEYWCKHTLPWSNNEEMNRPYACIIITNSDHCSDIVAGSICGKITTNHRIFRNIYCPNKNTYPPKPAKITTSNPRKFTPNMISKVNSEYNLLDRVFNNANFHP